MIISVQGPRYWSPGDEDVFFHWLNSLKAVRSWRGVGSSLELTLGRRKVSERDLRELYALFRRYQMDVELLEPLNQPRPDRLKNLTASSHRNVFPRPRSQ